LIYRRPYLVYRDKNVSVEIYFYRLHVRSPAFLRLEHIIHKWYLQTHTGRLRCRLLPLSSALSGFR
jgi:hypothetical protein